MAIVQISKIQHRSGNLVDLPQLDEAEFGWASDQKRLFIGKTTPNENIEVLTSYSQINFSQINGAVGNLNISPLTVENGQVLTFDGNNWVNRGGYAGGLITLGDVSNVKISGGAIGYVLETDGAGNLSWTPKSTIVAYVQNITLGNGSPGNYTVITTTADSAFGQGAAVTITGVIGTTELNSGTYYTAIQSANSFALFTDANLTTALDSTGYGVFPYATVSDTSSVTDRITVSDATYFTIGDPVVFKGELGDSKLNAGRVYYVKDKDVTPPNTWIVVSETEGGDSVDPGTSSGLNVIVYASGGRLISSVNSGAGGVAFPGGSNTSIQFNKTSTLGGSADFTYNDTSKQFTLNGNANVGNLNVSGVVTSSRFISNATNGTTPLEVLSSTRVANLNVSYANVSDYSVVTEQSSGTYYPVLASSNTTANYALASNANISFNIATGLFTVGSLAVSANANIGNLNATGLINASGNIAGGNLSTGGALNVTGNANIGNLGTGRIIASGNISGTQIISNIATGTPPLVVESTTQVANLNAATAGKVIDNAQPNITSVGTLSSLSVTGTVTAGNIFANSGTVRGNLLTGTLTTAAQPNITSVGTLSSLAVNGNVSAGNISTSGRLSASNVSFTGSNVSLGEIGNIQITGGTSGYVIVTDGTGNLSFANPVTVGTQPAGVNTQVQFNDAGSLGASSAFTFNKTTNELQVSGNISTATRLISTIASGTPPIVVNSTTRVPNLNVATAGYADTAGSANIANTANYANSTGSASSANTANTANYANTAGSASTATNASYASSAGSVAWTNVSGRPTNVSSFNNDAGYITAAQSGSFPSGTRMMFAQSSAPTGWTKDTSASLNDSALRIVTGGAGSGGAVGFTSAFSVQSVSGSVGSTSTGGTVGSTAVSGIVGSTALTVDQIPAHSHNLHVYNRTIDGNNEEGDNTVATFSAGVSGYIDETGGGQGHTHSFSSPSHSHAFTGDSHSHSFSGAGIDLRVKYVDVIIATKN